MKSFRWLGALCVFGAALLPAPAAIAEAPKLEYGVASGDVSDTTAIIWSRADRAAEMTVSAEPASAAAAGDDAARGAVRSGKVTAKADADFTAQIELSGLTPDTPYRYRVEMATADARAEQSGSFRTAPAPDAARAVSFIVVGDLGGQAWCRHPETGYAIFRSAAELRPDFFIANGDMIYADGACPPETPDGQPNIPGDFAAIDAASVDWQNSAQVLEVYRAHWRYNRADPAVRDFLQQTPMFAQWDDHEVINDFGGPWPGSPRAPERAGYPNLVALGRRVLFEWHPMRRDASDPERIYRASRWGRNAALFFLDARSYRSPNAAPDTAEAGKTMLGPAQLAWLKNALRNSTATWNVISSDVPLSVPTGSSPETLGRDAFATGDADPYSASTGFERELLDLVAFLDRHDVRNVVFVATDVHFAAQVRYDGDYDGDGDRYTFHEFISGPLRAVRSPAPVPLDATLHPTLLYAEGGLFNFAFFRIETTEAGVRLHTDVRDEAGRVRPGSALDLIAD